MNAGCPYKKWISALFVCRLYLYCLVCCNASVAYLFTTLHVDQEDGAEILFCREKDTVLAAGQENAAESGG